MKNERMPEVPETPLVAEERQRRRDLRRAVIFGIAMATIQMALLLYFVYC